MSVQIAIHVLHAFFFMIPTSTEVVLRQEFVLPYTRDSYSPTALLDSTVTMVSNGSISCKDMPNLVGFRESGSFSTS
jgi:hypothetical protein